MHLRVFPPRRQNTLLSKEVTKSALCNHSAKGNELKEAVKGPATKRYIQNRSIQNLTQTLIP